MEIFVYFLGTTVLWLNVIGRKRSTYIFIASVKVRSGPIIRSKAEKRIDKYDKKSFLYSHQNVYEDATSQLQAEQCLCVCTSEWGHFRCFARLYVEKKKKDAVGWKALWKSVDNCMRNQQNLPSSDKQALAVRIGMEHILESQSWLTLFIKWRKNTVL